MFLEALFPAGNRRRAGLQSLDDLRVGPAIGQRQDQPRPEHITGR
jgi:hypothetical protein